jgi:muramoyltetrapeptide carboxypeptidase
MIDNMTQPPFLKEGDRVALVSPAYWIPQEAILEAAEVVKSWGLHPVIGPHTNSLNVNVYAGTADERAADIIWALEDDSIKAIICTRGGYGSIHLLNRIPLELYQKHPKWLIGHGDITTLLYTVTSAGMMSIHGPMTFQIAAKEEPSCTILRDILFGAIPQYKVAGNDHNRCGHAEGLLVGGNLSSYSAIAGSRFPLPPDQDIILFLEEVEESLHDIDRLFYMLRLQIDFERVKGIIFGTFNSIKFDLQFGSVEQMLVAHMHDTDIPVCCGFPIGSNSCLPVLEGAPCSLDVLMDEVTLTFDIEGTQKSYNISRERPQLVKDDEIA